MKPQYGTTLFLITFLILLLQGCTLSSDGTFNGGSGTEANPYQISTIDQLQAIGDEEHLDKHFIQVADIDASISAEFQNGSGFKHIGNKEAPFTGSYNGNGFKITDLYLHIQKSGVHNGLFGYVKEGLIENVTIKNSFKTSQSQLAHKNMFTEKSARMDNLSDLPDEKGLGGLVGYNENGIVRNCAFTGEIVGPVSSAAGGLVGINTGVIENSSFEGNVSGGGGAGLVAINTGKIINSFTRATVNAMGAAGLVQRNIDGEIIYSYAEANVYGSLQAAGLVGSNNAGSIRSSFATGIVSAYDISAGLVGINNGEIMDSYSLSDIDVKFDHATNRQTAGGLTGINQEHGTVIRSFSAGLITNSEESVHLEEIAGVSGVNEGITANLFWSMDASSQSQGVGTGNTEGATGLTTAQMTGLAAETHMPEFDWQTVWRTTDGYPILRWQEDE